MKPFMAPPMPYLESDCEVFWPKEAWDANLPGQGFIQDFVLATKGVETPTIFCAWSAIYLLSAALKRESWLQWFPSNLYPNLFLVFVGPPKSGKSTAVRFGEKMLMDFHNHLPETRMREEKRVNLLQSKATPESFIEVMQPEEVSYVSKGEDGTTRYGMLRRGSQCSLIISELETFLGKQKYNQGLIGKLTDLYDCKDVDTDATRGQGIKKLEDIYFTLLGATTPTALTNSIPEEAFGDGFMSRVILVTVEKSERRYPEPRQVVGAPGRDELSKRLAWIAQNAYGEYTLSDEARAYHQAWYYRFRDQLDGEINAGKRDIRQRMDIHQLKLALLVRAQRYEPGREITLADYKAAERILTATFNINHRSLEDVGASDYKKAYNRVRGVIQEKKKVQRRRVLTATSPYGITADFVTKIIEHLHQEELITVWRDGHQVKNNSKSGAELYCWEGGEE